VQIELISPASEDSAYLPRLGLGLLAALTPREDEVIYTDDLVRPFDTARDLKDVDLVGISVDSKTARRSYEISSSAAFTRLRCRKRRPGTPTRSSLARPKTSGLESWRTSRHAG
jgi:hypothetical protein